MYEFQVSLTEEDYVDFNIHHAFYAPQSKQTMRVGRWILPVMLLLLFLVATNSASFEEKLVPGAFLAIILLCWVVFFKKIMMRSIKKRIQKMKAVGKLPYSETTCVQFHEDYIIDISEDLEVKAAYTKIERIAIAPTATYVYCSVMQAFILPDKMFSDTADRLSLLRFLEEKTGKTPEVWGTREA